MFTLTESGTFDAPGSTFRQTLWLLGEGNWPGTSPPGARCGQLLETTIESFDKGPWATHDSLQIGASRAFRNVGLPLYDSPYFPGSKTATVIAFFRAYKRILVSSLVFAYAAFLLITPRRVGRFVDLSFFALLVMLIASHLFWIRRVLDLGERFIPGKPRRAWRAVAAGLVYVYLFFYLFFLIQAFGSLEYFMNHIPRRRNHRPSHPSRHQAGNHGIGVDWNLISSVRARPHKGVTHRSTTLRRDIRLVVETGGE